MRAPAEDVVVFDLDGTLVRGSTFARFLRSLVLRDVWRCALVITLSPLLLLPLLLPRNRRHSVSLMLWAATLARSDAALRNEVERYATWLVDDGHAVAPVVRELREHLAAGHRVVVASACPDLVASAVVRRLSADAEVVASRLVRLGPVLSAGSDWCSGGAKVDMLRRAGFPPAYHEVYSDNLDDLPLMMRSGRWTFVDPRPWTRLRVGRRRDAPQAGRVRYLRTR